ncbi:MAG: cytochrome-c oxidase [Bacteroidetes bacterium HGW-Bacteroidetes-15]|nr:MAG: cytochrome-c oxidase [Bacteroidetes bacterium HGW-Bacteroidetes-15]
MEQENVHVTPYRVYGVILVILLCLTALTILVTWVDAGKFAIAIAMAVACVKATLVLFYFMHLKFDNWLIRALVGLVLLLLIVIFVITFFDYLFR